MKYHFVFFAGVSLVGMSGIATAGCGVSANDVLATIQEDCEVRSVLQTAAGPELKDAVSCRDMNLLTSKWMRRAVGAGVGVALGREGWDEGAQMGQSMASYFKSQAERKYMGAIHNSIIEASKSHANISKAEWDLLATAFAENPSLANMGHVTRMDYLSRLLDSKDYHFKSLVEREKALQKVESLVEPTAEALQLRLGSSLLNKLVGTMAKLTNSDPALLNRIVHSSKGKVVGETLKWTGKVGGSVLGAFTAFGIWQDLTAPKNCQGVEDRLTPFFPLDARCRPSFRLNESQRRLIVDTIRTGGKANAFQLELDRSPELCHQYTRIVAYRNSLDGFSGQPANFPDVDFSCREDSVKTINFRAPENEKMLFPCAPGVDFNSIAAARIASGDFKVFQACATQYDNNWKAPSCKTAMGSEVIGPQGRDTKGFNACMGGRAPDYNYAQLKSVYDIFQKSCKAMSPPQGSRQGRGVDAASGASAE